MAHPAGTRAPSPRNPAETRQRILDAAGQLFYRDGVRPVAMDAVAEAADVTKRTLYYHFDSKNDLVIAYLGHMGERLRASMGKAAARRAGGPLERLLGVFDDLGVRLADARFRGCPFLNTAAELSGSERVRAAAVTYKEDMRRWLEGQLAELGARDPGPLSEQLMILTDGAIGTWLVRRDPQAAARAREAARVLIQADLPTHSAVATRRCPAPRRAGRRSLQRRHSR